MTTDAKVRLYRPVGQQELDLIRDSGGRRFPPRLFWQPIFYPVLTEDHEREYLRLTADLERAFDESRLPEVSRAGATINDLLVRIRLAEVLPQPPVAVPAISGRDLLR